MELTPENKEHIDSLSHYQLLSDWRFGAAGDPWFQGETGKYWGEVMAKKRDEAPGNAIVNSKALGW